MTTQSLDPQEPVNWAHAQLTEEDLDLLRRFGSGYWCVFQVPLPGGRSKTRYARMLGRKVEIVDWMDGGEAVA